MEIVRAKQERHQKRQRDEDENDAESAQEVAVPRNRLSINSASGATTMEKSE